MFSKACEYALRAAIYIAGQSLLDRKAGLKEIAENIHSPESFTAKILQQLAREGLIHSEKGPNGGFSMNAEKLSCLRLSHIVSVIDGEDIYKGCGLGLESCNEEKPCPMHGQFKSIRNQLKKMLETTHISALARQLEEGSAVLKLS